MQETLDQVKAAGPSPAACAAGTLLMMPLVSLLAVGIAVGALLLWPLWVWLAWRQRRQEMAREAAELIASWKPMPPE